MVSDLGFREITFRDVSPVLRGRLHTRDNEYHRVGRVKSGMDLELAKAETSLGADASNLEHGKLAHCHFGGLKSLL
jgi:hypothetical protein